VNNFSCCLVRISGRVQGVGFRMWTFHEARRLQIHGWVRNTPDGQVEACLVATPDRLEQMLEVLRQGPPLARVTTVERTDIDPPDRLEGFSIME
jgi:acylphosphatase